MSTTIATTVYIRWRAMVRGPGLSKRTLVLIRGPCGIASEASGCVGCSLGCSCDPPPPLEPVRTERDDLDEEHEDEREPDEDPDPLGGVVVGEQPHPREGLDDTEDTGDGGVLQQR